MDNRAFKELLSGIYDRINTFYRGTLSSNQKYIMGFESNLKSQLNTQIQKSENKILNEVANQTGGLHKRFDDVCEILAENANSPLDPSVVWKVYEVLSRVIMNGKILEVVNILPLVQNKSLKCGLDFLIHVISNDQLYDYSFEMIERDVEDERIYADLIEKTIYILYARNDLELINKIGNRNADLYDIAKCLYHNSLDVFFILQVKRENGFLYYEYKMNEKYPKYNWLVKRICMVEMLKLNIANASEGIIQVIGLAENIIDSILLYERRIQELLVNSKKKNSDVDKVIVALDDLLDRINGLSYYFRAKYYLTCLQARLILSSEDVMKYYDSLPSDIKQNGKIVMFKIQADLDSGKVDESLLLNTCIKEDEYWLLNNYLIHVVNNNPRYAKDIIEKYKFICDKDASIFLIYVQLIAHIENKENAVELLREYETRYGDRLDYWAIKLSIEYADDELERISSKWLNGELEPSSNETVVSFVKLLVKHGKYDHALQKILQIENTGNLSLDLKKLKALALLRTQREIEALEIYKDLFVSGAKTEEIIYYVLALSLKNKRSVSEDIIEIAKTSDNAKILSLAAEYVAQYGSHDEACNLVKRALYRSGPDDIEIVGQFLGVYIKKDAAITNKTDKVDVNTAVLITSVVDKSEIVYCVHPKGELPDQFLFWDNSKHIIVETAIKIGLYKKQVGDEIDISSEVYSISRIEPIDTFLFRVCMERLVKSGQAIAIKTGTVGNKQLIADEFIQQVKTISGDDNSSLSWLEQYKDTSSMPAPLYCCFSFGRMTYTKLVSLLIEEPSIVFREMLGTDNPQSKGYVLSTAALVALSYIGVDPDEIPNLVIPSTLKRLVSEDVDKAISEYGRDIVASIGVLNDKLYCMEATEKEKNAFMSDAIKLKEYTSDFSVVENESDLVLTYDKKFDLKSAVGIVDYDAISIAKKRGLTLVSAEVPLTAVCSFEEINIPHCCIADFLAHTCDDWEVLTEYIKHMMEYRFLIPFTHYTVKRLDCAYFDGTEEVKTKIIKTWQNLLYMPIEDNNYKLQLVNCFREILSQELNKNGDLSPIWRCLMLAIVKYAGLSIQLNVSEEGEISANLVKVN